MNNRPNIPPIYALVEVDAATDSRPQALDLAIGGAEPATLVWSNRPDRLDAAVVLAPEGPLDSARLAFYIAQVGLADAIGAIVPAGVDLAFAWPDRLMANMAEIGRVGIDVSEACDSDGAPAWIVVSVEVAVAGEKSEDPERIDLSRTSLEDEGCLEVTPAKVLESFSRHFLAWVNRFQDDGFGPVRTGWLHRFVKPGDSVAVTMGDAAESGAFVGIDDAGALVLAVDGAERAVTLTDALNA